MVIKDVSAGLNPFGERENEIIVFVTIECPRKTEGCRGDVELHW